MSQPQGSEGKVSVERRGHVLLMGIDRVAKRNAFDVPMLHALSRAYGELDRDPELRCGVLFAHGDHFTAGLDLVQFAPVFQSGKWGTPDGGLDPLGIEGPRVRKPVIAAIAGICLTIGIELMLATDIRVCSTTARFGQIEIKRGIYPVGGATLRFHREAGWGNAMRYLLTGDEFGAEEARAMGLVQEVTAPGEHLTRALALAETVAAQAPLGVQATLASARLCEEIGERAAAARLLPDLQPVLASDDVKEGIASFVERRAARFTGRLRHRRRCVIAAARGSAPGRRGARWRGGHRRCPPRCRSRSSPSRAPRRRP
jgi:enoyl-CoA hydratase